MAMETRAGGLGQHVSVPVLLAGLSAIAFGCGDLLGGVAIRRSGRQESSLGLAMVATMVGAVLIGTYVLVRPPEVVRFADVAWPVAAGLFMAVTRPLMYLGMARGPVAVFAPVFGLTMIAVPAVIGPFIGERLAGLEVLGVLSAVVSVVLLSGEGGVPRPGRLLRSPAVGLAVVVGTSIGMGGVFLTQAAPEAGELPALLVLVSGLVVLPVFHRVRIGTFRPDRAVVGFGVVLGVSSGTAMVLSTAAYLRGSAAVVTALIALAPGVSVVIAWRFLGERLYLLQAVGGAFGVAAVVAFALAG